jgi:hypothetical protein
MADERAKRPTRDPKEHATKRQRLSVTSEEIEDVAGGYWNALDAMARATTTPDDAETPTTSPPRRR